MKKPTSMLVLGIINICFAGMGILNGLFAMALPFLAIPGMDFYGDLRQDSTFVLAFVGLGLVGVASKLAMGVSGIGLVKGKGWGRSLGNLWAVFSILYGISLAIINGLYIQPKMVQAMEEWMKTQPGMGNQPASPFPPEAMVVVAIVWGLLMATVYQVVFLILNNRKAVRDYLSGEGGAGDGDASPAYGYEAAQPAPQAEPEPTSDSPW